MGRAHGIATGSGAAPRIELPRCHMTTKNHNPHASHPSLCSLARKVTGLAQPGDETVEFTHPRVNHPTRTCVQPLKVRCTAVSGLRWPGTTWIHEQIHLRYDPDRPLTDGKPLA